MLFTAIRTVIIFMTMCFFSTLAVAQESVNTPEKTVQDLTAQFEQIKKRAAKKRIPEKRLIAIQDDIDKLQRGVSTFRSGLEPKIADLRTQLKRLGPAPAKGAPPETETVANERKTLNNKLGIYDGADKKALLLLTQMTQLRRQVQDLRLAVFTREIFRRYDSPLGSEVWVRVFKDAKVGFERSYEALIPEKKNIAPNIQIFGTLLIISVLWLALYRISQRTADSFRVLPVGEQDPPFFRRASSALIVSFVRLFPWVLTSVLLYFAGESLGLYTAQMEKLSIIVLFAFIIFFIVSALTKTLLAPNRPVWRLFPLSDQAARLIYRQIQCVVFVYSLNIVWSEINEMIKAPLSLSIGQSFIFSIIFATILALLAYTRFQNGEPEDNQRPARSRLSPWWLKLPLWLIVMAIVVSAAMGYISFSRFLSAQVVVSGAIAVFALLFYIAIDELTSDMNDNQTVVGRWFDSLLELGEVRRKQVVYLIGLVLQLALIAVFVPMFLFQWGFSWGDIRNWVSVIFFGIQVGSVNISFSTIIFALALFTVGLIITRLAQKWLERGPLTVSNFQDGVVDSVRTGVGYLGFAISLVLAISYVGVDFTNVAIVAGALSVGIGFGLQSIVNNFVSGLILLVERPVKVGDWVVLGDKQGYVRRIRVRYTEIETFDRSSLIIPNSDLISGTIMNWTHGNTVGRVVINVGVAYSSEARKVHDLLLEIGKKHPQCLTYPSPSVIFENFGESSLDFALRIFIANITDVLKVGTDLRLTILEVFQQQGIEIPFPQRDLHIRSPEILKVGTNET